MELPCLKSLWIFTSVIRISTCFFFIICLFLWRYQIYTVIIIFSIYSVNINLFCLLTYSSRKSACPEQHGGPLGISYYWLFFFFSFIFSWVWDTLSCFFTSYNFVDVENWSFYIIYCSNSGFWKFLVWEFSVCLWLITCLNLPMDLTPWQCVTNDGFLWVAWIT